MLSKTEIPPETNCPDLLAPELVWYVAYTKWNQEKEVARTIGCFYFLPYEASRSKSRNLVLKPLFPQYIFVGAEGNLAASFAAFATDEVQSVLSPMQHEIRKDLQFLAAGTPETRHIRREPPVRLREGQRVRFRQGHPYAGTVGVVSVRERRVYVELLSLGQLISVETDPENLCEIR